MLRTALTLMLTPAGACTEHFDGPPQILPAQLAPNAGRLLPIADGDVLPLVQPVQGGFVLFVGVLGRNLSTRSGSLLGELRRSQKSDGTPLSAPGGVLYFDERSIDIEGLGDESEALGLGRQGQTGVPNFDNMANIPTCPNSLDVDVVDNPLFLVVRYRDAQDRSASAVRKVLPRCLQPDDDARRACMCQCQAGYTTDRCLNHLDGSALAVVPLGLIR